MERGTQGPMDIIRNESPLNFTRVENREKQGDQNQGEESENELDPELGENQGADGALNYNNNNSTLLNTLNNAKNGSSFGNFTGNGKGSLRGNIKNVTTGNVNMENQKVFGAGVKQVNFSSITEETFHFQRRNPVQRRSPKEKEWDRQHQDRSHMISGVRDLSLSSPESSHSGNSSTPQFPIQNRSMTPVPTNQNFGSQMQNFQPKGNQNQNNQNFNNSNNNGKFNWIWSLLGEFHPANLIGYLHFGFNLAMIVWILYVVTAFGRSIYADIELKALALEKEAAIDIQLCLNEYEKNKCNALERIPAMEKLCLNWEMCFNKDPSELAWTKISAQTVAETFDSFIQPLSWKSIGFIFLLMVVINLCFMIAKFASGYGPAPQKHNNQVNNPPNHNYQPNYPVNNPLNYQPNPFLIQNNPNNNAHLVSYPILVPQPYYASGGQGGSSFPNYNADY